MIPASCLPKMLRLLLLLLLPIATAVDDPGFHALSASRTSFLGVKGSLTVNDALALKHFAEEICIVGEEGEGAEKTTLKYAEVGSYLGLSATIVAAACPRSIIFAHDLFPSIADDGAAAGCCDAGLPLSTERPAALASLPRRRNAGWRLSLRVKLARCSARRDSEVVRSRSKKLAVSSAPRRV